MVTPGQAVPGTVVPTSALVTPGGAQGIQGVQGTAGPSTPSTDAGNLLVRGSDSLLSLPPSAIQPTIWSARLRSRNSVGNPGFEIDQRNAGGVSSFPAGSVGLFICDRWNLNKGLATATMAASQATGNVNVPGTNFRITGNQVNIQLTAQQATLAANEFIQFYQTVEGPRLRELINDVHSVSLLVSCTQAISFTLALVNTTGTAYSFTKLCSIPANTLTLVTVPNIPIWPSGSTWPITPGSGGYFLKICLASGSTFIAPSDGVWNAGNFMASPGTTNFASLPINTLFSVSFVQHEPGPLCTTLIDKPFTQNLDECKRYYCSNYAYGTAKGTANCWKQLGQSFTGTTGRLMISFPKDMAKTPTGTAYGVGGGINMLWLDGTAGASDYACGPLTCDTTGVQQVQFNAAIPTANQGWAILGNYVADTGW